MGLERAAKQLALTLDAALSDAGAFLDGAALRGYGHRLDRLVDAVEAKADARDVARGERPAAPIHRAILATLTDFAANVKRYYNLEILASASVSAHDPIAVSHTTVAEPVLAAHYTDERRLRDEARAAAIALPGSAMVSVIATGETGEPIRDLADTCAVELARGPVDRGERMYVLSSPGTSPRSSRTSVAWPKRGVFPVPYLEEYFYAFQLEDRDFRNRKVCLLEL